MCSETVDYRTLYEQGKALLEEAQIEEAVLDARLLLEFVCGTNRNTLLVHGDMPVEAEKVSKYWELMQLRATHKPLQQITGEQDFMGLCFSVDENVLIPRQDTEILVEEAMKELHDGMHVLDMCTGSGCILISLLHYSNECVGLGVDLSEKALQVARENAERLLRDVNRERKSEVTFLQSDLFERVTGTFDMIVSNPPYIPAAVVDTLMPEVKDFEPRMALDGDEDGLAFYRRIVQDGKKHLKHGGSLFFEIGCDQADAVSRLLSQAGFSEVRTVKDYAGLDRVVCAVWLG